ncbi:hypothetical protein L7F22_024071 [Adiantum nelumboides]|nr:hypothetical protein [Adiantum nelumboides]
MDPAKMEAIRNWPDLKNVHEVRSFLGLCSYFRRYVRKFVEIASPLHMLTQKGVPFSWGATEDLRAELAELIPGQQERLKQTKAKCGGVSLGEVTVDMAIGGMRGIKGMLWDTSLLDPEEGIRFRGLSIPECQKLLPAAIEGGEPLPEGILWLLVTGKVPTQEQALAVSKELKSRAQVSGHVFDAINALPKSAHPMTQFTAGIMALQVESEFQRAYEKGIHKSKFWEPVYEDSMNLIARLPEVAAYIYRRIYKEGQVISADNKLDYGANFAHMLGFTDAEMHELMRLYLTIHSDHEGGNVSAHTVRLKDQDLLQSVEIQQEVTQRFMRKMERQRERLSAKKSEFFLTEVAYLGYIISADGVKLDPAKVEQVENWELPKTAYDVRSFLGLCQAYSSHIKNFTRITAPMSDVLKGVKTRRQRVVLSKEAVEAFEALKVAVTQAPCLILASWDDRLEVWTDVSNVAIGAVLQQHSRQLHF